MADTRRPVKKYYVVSVLGPRRKSWIVCGWAEVVEAREHDQIVFKGFHTQEAAEKHLASIARS